MGLLLCQCFTWDVLAEFPLRNKSNTKPRPMRSNTRHSYVRNTLKCLPEIWDHGQVIRGYWHCCFPFSFNLFNPQTDILCITCASDVLVRNEDQGSHLWTEEAFASGCGSFLYLCITCWGLRQRPHWLISYSPSLFPLGTLKDFTGNPKSSMLKGFN